ncbi:MAG: chemotaxis protein CheW [Rhodocyclaceae bacterium]|nr:chemotaxis protein CheW [Rhodocyclaceae bacterium]MBX3668711.1 chemotaxis protein CheW [Rhodocyclaceae bacterium]
MAKKISLREFQASLAQRLASAQRGGEQRAMLGLQAGEEFWVIDLADSGEILPVPPITSVPITKPWYLGLANIRGSLWSVVDFAAFQGGDRVAQSGESRILLPHARFGINSALLVRRALGLRNPDDFEPAAGTEDARPWVGECLRDLQGRTWRRLKLRELFAEDRFLDVTA